MVLMLNEWFGIEDNFFLFLQSENHWIWWLCWVALLWPLLSLLPLLLAFMPWKKTVLIHLIYCIIEIRFLLSWSMSLFSLLLLLPNTFYLIQCQFSGMVYKSAKNNLSNSILRDLTPYSLQATWVNDSQRYILCATFSIIFRLAC